MNRWMKSVGLIVLAAAVVPPLWIARARSSKSPAPRVHLIADMDDQPKVKTQRASTLFSDGRAMRPVPAGTVARGQLQDDDHLLQGRAAGDWATAFPIDVSLATLRRGRERFDVFCAACHGLDGTGRGAVAVRAEELGEGAWVPPTSMHTEEVRQRPVGHLFNTISNGIRTMPSYASQIPVEDRWAIVAYVRALQRSQHSKIEDVPEEKRDALR